MPQIAQEPRRGPRRISGAFALTVGWQALREQARAGDRRVCDMLSGAHGGFHAGEVDAHPDPTVGRERAHERRIVERVGDATGLHRAAGQDGAARAAVGG